ncbi:ATP-grasp domain-containing protein [Sulfurimonas sp.]
MNDNIKLYSLNKESQYQYCAFIYPFRFFYNLKDNDKSPKNISYNEDENIPDYITFILKSFTNAFSIFTNEYGFKNPLAEGVYFNKGAKFIDVMIVDIPVQKGLVASDLVDNSSLFEDDFKDNPHAVRILLDRNLIKNSATPIHELFHVFQYSYNSFNNMWFMEGLARWSQNLTHKRENIQEILPQSINELIYLLNREHDAEYFWRELIYKCNSLKFVRTLLEQTTVQAEVLEEEYKNTNKYNTGNWAKIDKKSSLNNKYIFRAIIDTIDVLQIKPDNELKNFINSMNKYQNTVIVGDVDLATLSKDELKRQEDIEVIDGDLIIEATSINILNNFNKLKKVNTIRIKDNENLSEILGFNSLVSVKNIEISNNKNLESIYAFYKFFKSVKKIDGYIKISSNKKLKSVDFLRGLAYVGSSFYLHNNALNSLNGLEDLEEVDASLSLSSNALTDLLPLKKLKKVNGMLGVAYNQLSSLDGIDNLTKINTIKWNGEYRSIAMQENTNLNDISALKEIKSSKKHCIIYLDSKNNYDALPEKDSEFYNQDIIIKTKNSVFNTKSIFPNYKKLEKVKILFLDKWKNTIGSVDYIDSYFDEFKDINKVIDYCKLVDIKVIFAQVVFAQNFVNKHRKLLEENGIKFIINDKVMLDTFVNKKKFYHFMIDTNMSEYIPQYYKDVDDVKFPAIIKAQTGGNGRNMEIVYNKEELLSSEVDGIVSEYIPDTIEYATHVICKDDKVLTSITYKKTSLNEFYIMKQNTGAEVKFEIIQTPFIDIFAEILSKVSKNSGYSLACIDYKIVDNKPKIFEINPRLGYTLFKRPDDLKSFIDIYTKELNVKTYNSKEKILFGDKWQSKTSNCDWLDAYHINFKDIDKVIKFAKENKIKNLFANNYNTQKAILNNQDLLRESGLKFIVNSEVALQNFVDKQLFYEKMLENNLQEYVPRYYDIDDEINYPCIVKTRTGGAGRGIFLAYNKEDIGEVNNNIIISEYLSSNVEYATSVFSKDGKILKAITFSKTNKKDVYVLQQEDQSNIVVKKEDTQFLEIFEKIIVAVNGEKGYCQCSINFKIQNGIPKIFEINPRIGYTLAGFSDHFESMVDLYIKELAHLEKAI